MAVVALAASVAPAKAATWTVTNNLDVGAGSLHDAIDQANNNPGHDEIEFNIPGAAGPHKITLNTHLPAITDEVNIKGYSQPGASQATANVRARLMIVIDAGLVITGQAKNGLVLTTNNSAVRGLVIQNALGFGIRVLGDRNHIAGNIIGIDQKTGVPTDLDLANDGDGVHIRGDDNVVGGFGPEDRNVITGNGLLHSTGANGVLIVGSRNAVRGNTIGTDTLGQHPGIGNNGAGVRLAGDHNHVGGTNAGAGNLISNNAIAVLATTGTGNTIENNLIGTDRTGMGALGQSRGVVIESSHTVVAGNVIAATAANSGVEVIGDHNIVQGNKIGTDAVAVAALPNLNGIRVSGKENTIGGHQVGEGNVVSGNIFNGIQISSVDPADPAVRNIVEGNLIGTDGSGMGPLPNGGDGIQILDSDNNTIGAWSVAGAGNTIAHNARNGVNVISGARNTILGNSITANNNLGIDLADDGITLNDEGDDESGANGLQNYPKITSATAGVNTKIDWTFNSKPSSTYLLEFYLSNICDVSMHGEGETVLGSLAVITDAAGDAAGIFASPAASTVGQFVAATATVYEQPELKATSEFSICMVVN